MDLGAGDVVPFVKAAVVHEGVRTAEAVAAHVQRHAGLGVRNPRGGREADCYGAPG